MYILKCADGTLYTGSTNDITKRLIAHNTGKRGAKYTRARRPVRLVHSESYKTKPKALARERAIKKLTRTEKLQLIRTA